MRKGCAGRLTRMPCSSRAPRKTAPKRCAAAAAFAPIAHALDQRIEFGVWGGMTERERRALLRRRPTVTSWRRLLETAREEHGRARAVTPAIPQAS